MWSLSYSDRYPVPFVLESSLGQISSNFTNVMQKLAKLWPEISERSSVNCGASTFTYFGFKFGQNFIEFH